MNSETKVIFSTKGQVIIPKKIRTKLGIEEGTEAIVSEENGRIIMQPINAAYIGGLRGRLGNVELVETLEAERAMERKPGS
jgi:AbrB family looped-hinge helix DNA binding protein